MAKKRIVPHAKLFDPDFKYVPADSTDITVTWRKAGWIPPSEYRTDYNFGKQERHDA